MNDQNEIERPDLPVEQFVTKAHKIDMCDTHTKDNWTSHSGYIENPDGTISCAFCPWGTLVAGYYRVVNGKVKDLRDISRGQ